MNKIFVDLNPDTLTQMNSLDYATAYTSAIENWRKFTSVIKKESKAPVSFNAKFPPTFKFMAFLESFLKEYIELVKLNPKVEQLCLFDIATAYIEGVRGENPIINN
jgi:hypothetical protein